MPHLAIAQKCLPVNLLVGRLDHLGGLDRSTWANMGLRLKAGRLIWAQRAEK